MRIAWLCVLFLSLRPNTGIEGSGTDDGELIPQAESLIRNFPCTELLGVDRALVHVFADDKARQEGLLVWASNSACVECSKQLVFNSSSDSPESFCANVWVPFPWDLYLTTHDSVILESLPDFKFGLYGVYNLTSTVSAPLDVAMLVAPNEHPNWPFQLLIILIVVTVVVSFALPYALKRARSSGPAAQTQGGISSDVFEGINSSGDVKEPLLPTSETGGGTEDVVLTRKKHPRLDCLDTFRGMCLAVMIYVNYGGGHYWFTEHSAWNGLTLADVLFPWFMWIMGCSMALSMGGIFEEPDENMQGRFLSVLRRSLTLFGRGLFLGNGYHVTGKRHHWRVPGVLQYFGISYFVVSGVMLLVRKRTAALLRAVADVDEDEEQGQGQGQCSWAVALSFPFGPYISCYRWELCLHLFLFFSYICLCLYASSFPGCPAGYNGPGGRSENGAWASCTGGIHRWVDEKVFGFERLYHSPTCLDLYDCQPYDPEGLLGSMGAAFLTFLGLMTGRVLLHHKAPKQRVLRWSFWGLVLVLVAGILCDFAQEGGIIPVNKNLWSVSFVLLLAGLGMLCLSVTYLLVDVSKVWSGAPFRWLGLNSILIYCAHGVFDSYFPFAWYQIPSQESHASLLLMNVVGALCWIAVAWYCYRIKFFIKV